MAATLIVPDIHNDFRRAESYIDRLAGRYERIVFLGDYFDDFGDSPEDLVRVAGWLSASVQDPRRLHLVGNHDLAYLYPGPFTFCSGFTHEKLRAIAPILHGTPRQHFRAAVEIDNWLVSHAGFHPRHAAGKSTGDLVATADALLHQLAAGGQPWLFAAGAARGGRASVGGITWLDWTDEFRPVLDLHQIVGHTPAATTRVHWMMPGKRHVLKRAHPLDREPAEIIPRSATTSTNVCLDTRLASVALVEGAILTLIAETLPDGEQVIVCD